MREEERMAESWVEVRGGGSFLMEDRETREEFSIRRRI
jgi:hypothetical protein